MEELGVRLREKRQLLGIGIREAAAQAGISQATLSRIEVGKMPDLDTFTKLCKWLEVDPSTILGAKKTASVSVGFSDATGQVFAHLRAKRTMNPDTTLHLARLIEAAQKEL
jgi:transcriptional regulator with XRE-family HTH domain